MLWLAVLLALLAAVPVLGVALFGRSFLYHPTSDDAGALALRGWRAERVRRPDAELVGLVRPAAGPWLLFFGGNAMGLSASRWVLEQCAGSEPWGLAAFAYRGYDGSDGSPSQAAILSDAEALVVWLEGTYGVAPSRLVVIGQSLGSGVAAHVSAWLARGDRPAAATVLLSPYVSMARVFDEQVPLVPVGWATPDPYRTDRLVESLRGPVVLIHGGADRLIPVEHSRELARLLGARARLVELPELAHNDLWDDARVVAAVRAAVP